MDYLLRFYVLTASADIFTGIYGFSIGISGLAYIGLGVGFFVATVVGAYFADRMYTWVCHPLTVSMLYQSDASSAASFWKETGG